MIMLRHKLAVKKLFPCYHHHTGQSQFEKIDDLTICEIDFSDSSLLKIVSITVLKVLEFDLVNLCTFSGLKMTKNKVQIHIKYQL